MAQIKLKIVSEGEEKIAQVAAAMTHLRTTGQAAHTVFNQVNGAMGKTMRALNRAGAVAGIASQFRDISGAAIATSNAINTVALALTAVNTAKGGLIALAAAAAAATGYQGYEAWKAKQQMLEAEAKLGEGIEKRAAKLVDAAIYLYDAGKITKEAGDRIVAGIADLPKDVNAAADALTRLSREVLPLMPTREKFEAEARLLDIQVQQKELNLANAEFGLMNLSRREKEGLLLKYLSDQEKEIAKAQQAHTEAFSRGLITETENKAAQLQYAQQLAVIEEKRAQVKGKGEPSPFTQMQDALEKSGSIGQFATTPFQGMFEGISTSIQGLLNLTMSWGEALRNIGTNILGGIIKGVADMVASWITGVAMIIAKETWKHGILAGLLAGYHALGRLLGWEQVAETNAQESAKAPALAANAATASVGTYGASAVVGMVLALAAIGAIIGFALGAFKEGGYTGNRGVNDPAGIVHGREFVVSAPAVQRIGLPALEAINRGEMPAGRSGRGQPILVGVYDDKQRMRDWLDTADGDEAITQAMARNIYKFRS